MYRAGSKIGRLVMLDQQASGSVSCPDADLGDIEDRNQDQPGVGAELHQPRRPVLILVRQVLRPVRRAFQVAIR